MRLPADTEMLEAICERSSDHWTTSDASTVTVPPDVMAKYVGVYSGTYGGNKRTIEVLVSNGQLFGKMEGAADSEGGLGAPGLDKGAPFPLVPRSQTMFEGVGLGFQFVVDDKGVVTDLVEIHISGPYKFPRQR